MKVSTESQEFSDQVERTRDKTNSEIEKEDRITTLLKSRIVGRVEGVKEGE